MRNHNSRRVSNESNFSLINRKKTDSNLENAHILMQENSKFSSSRPLVFSCTGISYTQTCLNSKNVEYINVFIIIYSYINGLKTC